MNAHVSLKSFHIFSTLYPKIDMLGKISEHFIFMETHSVRNHVNFQNLSYAIQQWPKVILKKKSY